ncbi:MAG: amidohydrolase family protein [Gammaproteobacteria bacterium]
MDAGGLVIAPGFIDVHTHYDAQIFWDPALSPTSLHGVTTVVAGHCGFSIAPVDATHADYMMRLLSRVEEIPLQSLQSGVPWGAWSTFAEYLACLDGRCAINVGFMVGHSALRRMAMGEAAVGRKADAAQLDRMQALLRESLAGGALGFSSSHGKLDLDHHGDPVPSRWADEEELCALAGVLREFPGTTLEWLPVENRAGDEPGRLTKLAQAAGRPVIWNLFFMTAGGADQEARDLNVSDEAARLGGRVVATFIPIPMKIVLSFGVGSILEAQPGWDAVRFSLPHAERLRAFADPDVRRRLREGAAKRIMGPEFDDFANYTLSETFAAANAGLAGRRVGEIAAERGRDPFDTWLDIVVADDLRTLFFPPVLGADADSWARRARLWGDPRTIVGGSDAGAHLTMLDTFGLFSDFVGCSVRDRRSIGLEQAVQLVTSVPAAFLGLHDRGRIAPGCRADLALFDPGTLRPGPVGMVRDLPGGAPRLYGAAEGMQRVIVAGTEIVRDGAYTGALPGRILRGGIDTR